MVCEPIPWLQFRTEVLTTSHFDAAATVILIVAAAELVLAVVLSGLVVLAAVGGFGY